MDFFNHQDQAKQRTKLLVALFALSVIALIVILNLLIAFLFIGLGEHESLFDAVNAKQWFTITLIVIAGVSGASFLRWAQLLGGGKVIAESMGGRLVSSDSQEFYHQRLLNVVEEVALASGMPVPPVYVIPSSAINAFAAGYYPSDAVIGVTEGATTKLSREQLQAVVAHEFSHILNGDMRLNIRIMALLFGILFIGLFGRFLWDIAIHERRSRSKDNSAAILILLALGLIVIGYCGEFFGKLIKAAMSRQREFLADASAVQFTRNPEGMSGALKVIGREGSRLRGPVFDEASHLFFNDVGRPSAIESFFALFATHPSLEERIMRIDPHWDGRYLPPQSLTRAQQESTTSFLTTKLAELKMAAAGSAFVNGDFIAKPSSSAEMANKEVPNQLGSIVRDPGLAPLLICALLLEKPHSPIYQQQLDALSSATLKGRSKQLQFYAELTQPLNAAERLLLVDVAVPALKQMDQTSYQHWRNDLDKLIAADSQVDIFEWCLYQLVEVYLAAHFTATKEKPRSRLKESQVTSAIAIVVATVAHFGTAPEQAEAAFFAGSAAGGFLLKWPTNPPTIKQLSAAMLIIGQSYPHVQGRLLKSLQAVANYDKEISAVEVNLLRTIAAIVDIPLNYREVEALTYKLTD